MAVSDSRTEFFQRCQRCLNHGEIRIRKNHTCPYKYPGHSNSCADCKLIEMRRTLNRRINEDLLHSGPIDVVTVNAAAGGTSSGSKVRTPICAACRLHGESFPLKSHRRICKYRKCSCSKCELIGSRRKVMAAQVKLRRAQKRVSNASPEVKSERDASIINCQLSSQTTETFASERFEHEQHVFTAEGSASITLTRNVYPLPTNEAGHGLDCTTAAAAQGQSSFAKLSQPLSLNIPASITAPTEASSSRNSTNSLLATNFGSMNTQTQQAFPTAGDVRSSSDDSIQPAAILVFYSDPVDAYLIKKFIADAQHCLELRLKPVKGFVLSVSSRSLIADSIFKAYEPVSLQLFEATRACEDAMRDQQTSAMNLTIGTLKDKHSDPFHANSNHCPPVIVDYSQQLLNVYTEFCQDVTELTIDPNWLTQTDHRPSSAFSNYTSYSQLQLPVFRF